MLTRTPEGEQKSRDADGTFATSPVEQIALMWATVTFYAAGPVGMVRGQRIKLELPT